MQVSHLYVKVATPEESNNYFLKCFLFIIKRIFFLQEHLCLTVSIKKVSIGIHELRHTKNNKIVGISLIPWRGVSGVLY